MKNVNSIIEIQDEAYIVKYSQPFCIPCKITQNNMENIEDEYDIPMYNCENLDEAEEFGVKTFPTIFVKTKEVSDNIFENYTGKITDTSVMMDEDELREELNKIIKGVKE